MQHLQGQTTEQTNQLNHNLEKEAIVVRIITIVTLLYLPSTFVSVRLPSIFIDCVGKYANLLIVSTDIIQHGHC